MDSVAPPARPCYVEVLTGRAPERHARTDLGCDFSRSPSIPNRDAEAARASG